VIEIPARFFEVPYDGSCIPDESRAVRLKDGANCQVFAYELLRHFGLRPPLLRSSELWSDAASTEVVAGELEPLDLLLFNSTPEAYGAHVAVYVGDGRAIHLSRRVGRPAVCTIEELMATPEHRCLIGAKRVRARKEATTQPEG
jgi:cell wall-associated NlpC family hydrolase